MAFPENVTKSPGVTIISVGNLISIVINVDEVARKCRKKVQVDKK